jgi:putative cardiolipin synthase
VLKTFVLAVFSVAVVLTIAHLVFRPPSLAGRTISKAVTASSDTPLGKLALNAKAGASSGVVPLLDGPDAFAARIALIRKAEVALDVQYYIWQRDATGLILLNELRQAAERGVRVRLLLDDNGIIGLDEDLAALNEAPNVEVRLFNPFVFRRIKELGYAFDFIRLNRRMHNKSLTADGAVSILGGRNIGDVYFGFPGDLQFIDTDVMVTGKAAADVGSDFDRYWQSGSAHPISNIVTSAAAGALQRLVFDASQAAETEDGKQYFSTMATSKLVGDLVAGKLEFEWTAVTLVSDDPAKGLGKAKDRDLLFPQLLSLISTPTHSVDLVSAYFIPGKAFKSRLQQLADEGIRVRILTNSQAATDVALVHSSYVKYRAGLLASGIELYELKPEHSVINEPDTQGLYSSRASLHSKTLAVDENRIFIGSFNFDPRSVFLNTEMGVVIDSPRLAKNLANAFVERFANASYQPALTQEGAIVWDEAEANGTTIRHETEPRTTPASRLALWIYGLFPIEWLL